jgi:hypothetical protein
VHGEVSPLTPLPRCKRAHLPFYSPMERERERERERDLAVFSYPRCVLGRVSLPNHCVVLGLGEAEFALRGEMESSLVSTDGPDPSAAGVEQGETLQGLRF